MQMYIFPSLALKKMKGVYGKLKFDFTKDNKSSFEYSQNDVFVSGNAIHETIFKVNKVNYSSIKTPNIQITRATFERSLATIINLKLIKEPYP